MSAALVRLACDRDYGDFALGRPAQSPNIPLANRIAEVAFATRTRRSDFEGLPAQPNFVLKNRIAQFRRVQNSNALAAKGLARLEKCAARYKSRGEGS